MEFKIHDGFVMYLPTSMHMYMSIWSNIAFEYYLTVYLHMYIIIRVTLTNQWVKKPQIICIPQIVTRSLITIFLALIVKI